MRKYVYAVGLAQLLLVFSQPAHAQDVTVLVVALAPPILLSPVCLAVERWYWLRSGPHSPARILPLFMVSCLEVFLWIVLSASAVVFMTGDWNIRALVWPVVAGVALWMLSHIWFNPSQRAARWLFFASPPVVLVLLAGATWLVLLAVGP